MLRAWLVDKPMPALGARYWGSLAGERTVGLLFTVGAFATSAVNAQANRTGGGVIRYQLAAFDASVCPFGARVGGRVRLYPCGALTLGRLQAQGIGLPVDRKDDALFVAAALEGRWIIRLADPLGLVGAAGPSVPLGEYTAKVDVRGNERPIGQTGSVGFVGALGLVLTTH
jgi:hypothetical protein